MSLTPAGPDRRDASRKALEEAIHAFYGARIRGDMEEYASYFAPDARMTIIGNPVLSPGAGLRIGRESIMRFLQILHEENSYLSHSITDIVQEGDQVVVRWQAEVRLLDSGRTGSFEVLDHLRIKDNLIVELTHFHDTGGMAIAHGRIRIA